MRALFTLLVAAAALSAATSCRAQLEPTYGIGIVHADVETYVCRDPDPVEALDCARDQCQELAPGQSCVRAAWCFPSGWSAVTRLWRGDLSTPSALCGAPTDLAVQRAVAEYCLAMAEVTSCDLVRLIDPAGSEKTIEGMQFPGGAPAPEEQANPDEAADPEGAD